GAEEGVGTGSKVGTDRGLAFADQGGDGEFLAFGAFDRDVVFERRRVFEVDRDLARLAGQAGFVEGERGRRGGELERPAGAFRACLRLWFLVPRFSHFPSLKRLCFQTV